MSNTVCKVHTWMWHLKKVNLFLLLLLLLLCGLLCFLMVSPSVGRRWGLRWAVSRGESWRSGTLWKAWRCPRTYRYWSCGRWRADCRCHASWWNLSEKVRQCKMTNKHKKVWLYADAWLTLNGGTPCEQVIPRQVQVHQCLLSGDIERPFETAGHSIALENSLLISGRVPLDLLRPLADVIEVMDPHATVVVMDAAHDIVSALRIEKGNNKEWRAFPQNDISFLHIYSTS